MPDDYYTLEGTDSERPDAPGTINQPSEKQKPHDDAVLYAWGQRDLNPYDIAINGF